jgi:hypothetical protein
VKMTDQALSGLGTELSPMSPVYFVTHVPAAHAVERFHRSLGRNRGA